MIKPSLSCSALQLDIAWHNPQKNSDRVEQLLAEVDSDIIVLPEMFTSGFTMQPEAISEDDQKRSLDFLKRIAKQKDALLIAGMVIGNAEYGFYNRLFAVFPNGDLKTYDKRHLFSFAGETKHYKAGKDRIIIEYLGWKICPLICYDLRFPVFARNSAQNRFDLQIFIANWPSARVNAWDTLLRARAIENQCYLVGVNRVGVDANEIPYNGHSAIIDPYGKDICQAEDGKEELIKAEFDYKLLEDFRKKFPVLNDADSFNLNQ